MSEPKLHAPTLRWVLANVMRADARLPDGERTRTLEQLDQRLLTVIAEADRAEAEPRVCKCDRCQWQREQAKG